MDLSLKLKFKESLNILCKFLNISKLESEVYKKEFIFESLLKLNTLTPFSFFPFKLTHLVLCGFCLDYVKH